MSTTTETALMKACVEQLDFSRLKIEFIDGTTNTEKVLRLL